MSLGRQHHPTPIADRALQRWMLMIFVTIQVKSPVSGMISGVIHLKKLMYPCAEWGAGSRMSMPRRRSDL